MRIGILGGGQLARMMSLAAYPLNIQTRIYEPAPESCAAQVTERIQGEYDDFRALFQFIQGCDSVTYEFENVPIETARWINERVPVYPPPEALRVSQDRIIEKTFLQDLGIRTPAFRAINSRADYDRAIQELGFPFVLKTTRFGYDGKGQMVVKSLEDQEKAWILLGGRPLILEQFVPFDSEYSIIAVRDRSLAIRTYDLIENQHREGILRRSVCPSSASETQKRLARKAAAAVMEKLDYVGVLTIEFFGIGEDLWANEMAPRVHNSGHWTINAAVTSQFENHMRAVAGLDLGSTELLKPVRMLNCIGRMPDRQKICADGWTKYHDYGKSSRAGRKVGHLTLMHSDSIAADSLEELFWKEMADSD
ncbi:5-(carboxyamino)imidazole ribonucleotide synthase [Telmatocola sphagniphila]|uniref:N5-carboxyaminoimidazole ribonucleotide synthase n=1 Tax=Telmatocola sphagniphila TaxID=1123043 RepID=A0A8E6B866_9BACT|nr:5-(carboxyamino)imidazole ribonucleotide synthase [Telmatocola sphagniphila]QVL33137.1 5-(carboxyamino)imidazole ribonucleotide synthase [Telmatocola sphagniphila]